MRILPFILAIMFSLVFNQSYAASNAENSPSTVATAIDSETQALLSKLTKAKLKKIIPILKDLEAHAGETLLPMFKVMLKGQLHYLKKDRNSLMSVKKVDGEKVFHEVFTGAELEPLKKKLYKKVRVNNKVRSYLRGAIARIQLSAKDPELRLSALTSLLSSLDESLIEAIQAVKVSEQDEEVLEMMGVALAIYALENSKVREERLASIETLAGRLENEIKNLLAKIVENDSDEVVVAAAQKALTLIEDRVANFQFVDKLFFGLSLGSVLLLAAIGLAITFGVMGVINMAHGEMIMLGAYTTYVVQLLMPNAIDYSIWVAIPAAFLVSGFVGICIERGVIRHLHGRPLETLLATFGISLILQQLVRTVFSPLNRQVETPSWMSGSLDINPVLSLTMNRLYILAFALLVFGLLLLILNKTSLGLNVRAVAQNRDMAKAMGIRTDWVDAMTFGLGSGIAGMAGVALSQLTNVGPNLGQAYIIDSFMVVVFGGVGNLWGTLVAGFSLGIANKFLEPVTGAVLASILVLVFIILFIQKKPKGLFPQKGRAAE